MRVCGVDYQGNDCVPVVIEHESGEWKLAPSSPYKITLGDLYNTEDVRLFAKALEAFLNENLVDLVIVRKRPTSGKYGGGAASFRMGGVLQVVTEKPVMFVSTRGIDSALAKHEVHLPEKLHKYQHRAFEVAMAHALSSG